MRIRTIPFLSLSLILCISACANNDSTSSSTDAEPDLGAAEQLDPPPQADRPGKLPIPDAMAMDQAGSSLAITPDATALVTGSPGVGAGSLLVHFRVDKQWWSDKRLQIDAGSPGARLGQSVDISDDGDIVIGGAPDESAPHSATGSVFVFERFGEGWSQTAQLQPGSDSAGALLAAQVEAPVTAFGEQVVISGDGKTIIASAPATSVRGNVHAGVVMVYQQINNQWHASQLLTASVPVSNGKFGSALALSPDAGTLFVSDLSDGGQVHVYTTAEDQYSLLETLVGDSTDGAVFGEAISVDTAATVLVVSERTHTNGSGTSGIPLAIASVYLRRNQQHWVLAERLTPSGIQSADSLISLSTSQDAGVIAVGLWSPGSELNTITTFVRQQDMAWRFASELPDPSAGLSGFASSLVLSGDGTRLLSGAPLLDHDGMPEAGGVYFY